MLDCDFDVVADFVFIGDNRSLKEGLSVRRESWDFGLGFHRGGLIQINDNKRGSLATDSLRTGTSHIPTPHWW